MITDVEGVFPSGAAVSMTPESSSQPLSLSSRYEVHKGEAFH